MHDEPSVSELTLHDWHLLIPTHSKYKGSKIDWDVDECCQALEQPSQITPRRVPVSTKKSTGNSMANRFHLLNVDDDGDGDVSPAFGPKKTIGIAA